MNPLILLGIFVNLVAHNFASYPTTREERWRRIQNRRQNPRSPHPWNDRGSLGSSSVDVSQIRDVNEHRRNRVNRPKPTKRPLTGTEIVNRNVNKWGFSSLDPILGSRNLRDILLGSSGSRLPGSGSSGVPLDQIKPVDQLGPLDDIVPLGPLDNIGGGVPLDQIKQVNPLNKGSGSGVPLDQIKQVDQLDKGRDSEPWLPLGTGTAKPVGNKKQTTGTFDPHNTQDQGSVLWEAPGSSNQDTFLHNVPTDKGKPLPTNTDDLFNTLPLPGGKLPPQTDVVGGNLEPKPKSSGDSILGSGLDLPPLFTPTTLDPLDAILLQIRGGGPPSSGKVTNIGGSDKLLPKGKTDILSNTGPLIPTNKQDLIPPLGSDSGLLLPPLGTDSGSLPPLGSELPTTKQDILPPLASDSLLPNNNQDLMPPSHNTGSSNVPVNTDTLFEPSSTGPGSDVPPGLFSDGNLPPDLLDLINRIDSGQVPFQSAAVQAAQQTASGGNAPNTRLQGLNRNGGPAANTGNSQLRRALEALVANLPTTSTTTTTTAAPTTTTMDPIKWRRMMKRNFSSGSGGKKPSFG